jgi:hypothetical protein
MTKVFLVLTVFAILTCASCAPEKTPTPATVPTVTPASPPDFTGGFGSSNKSVSGNQWVLPSGIDLDFGVLTSPAGSASLYNQSPLYGTLEFYFVFRNTNSTPATIFFPAGLIFPSADSLIQNAILVQADSIIVPPLATLYQEYDAYCMNEYRTFTYSRVFSTPVVSNNPNLAALLQILATKQPVKSDSNGMLQQSIWDIANTGKLTSADMTAIMALQ